MKKILAGLLSLTICLTSFVGCSSSDTTTADTSTDTSTSTAATDSSSSSDSGEVRTLHIAYVDPEDDEQALHRTALEFKASLEEISGGKMTLEISGGGVLGTETQLVEQCQLGTDNVEITIFSASNMGSVCDKLSMLALPWVFQNDDICEEYLSNPNGTLDALSEDILNDFGLQVFGYGTGGGRNWMGNGEQPLDVDSAKGKVFRVLSAGALADAYSTVGFIPSNVAFAEVYTAYTQGVIDVGDWPLSSGYSFGFHDICDWMIMTGIQQFASAWVMNADVWNSLSAEEQGWVTEAFSTGVETWYDLWDGFEADVLTEMEAAGCEVVYDYDYDGFTAAIAPVYDEYRQIIGEDFYDGVMAELEAIESRLGY